MTATLTGELAVSCGMSGHPAPDTAVAHVADQCLGAIGGGPVDLVLLFVTGPYVDSVPAIVADVHRRMAPRCLLGVTAESVAGGQFELERAPGVSALAVRAPRAEFRTFLASDLPAVDPKSSGPRSVADSLGLDPRTRGVFFFADPFSVPLVKLLPALSSAVRLSQSARNGEGRPRAAVIGGLASAARKPGGNRLIVGERVVNSGGVGVCVKDGLFIDAVVSQGCRPFGPPMVITKSSGNMILQLGGRPALEAVHDAVSDLSDTDRQKLQPGLFVGRVINEYRDRFGRDDFLIRNVMGVDQGSGSIAIGDLVRPGQTIRLHVRDAVTASEDLSLLLDAQKLYDRPAGALMISCNSRGTRLFSSPNHDVSAVLRAFAPPLSGEERAKVGAGMAPSEPVGPHPLPLAGFFAAGEIGPIGGESFMHTQSSCVALLREH